MSDRWSLPFLNEMLHLSILLFLDGTIMRDDLSFIFKEIHSFVTVACFFL